MRLRTFTAPTLDDAIALVRDALGEEAVIVSTYQSQARSRGAQVTAALERSRGRRVRWRARSAPEEVADLEPDDEIAQVLRFHRLDDVAVAQQDSRARRGRWATRRYAVLALAGALDSRTSRSPPCPATATSPVMVVGPPGVGKTVTVIKVAARAVLEGQQRPRADDRHGALGRLSSNSPR